MLLNMLNDLAEATKASDGKKDPEVHIWSVAIFVSSHFDFVFPTTLFSAIL